MMSFVQLVAPRKAAVAKSRMRAGRYEMTGIRLG
jgi:hypothetical protein